MIFLAGVTLTALAAIYVFMPLFQEPKGNIEVELLAETDLDRLLNQKAVVYSNLKDLEFEHKMGRLGEADFHRLEAGFKAEAAEILSRLDQLGAAENLDEGMEQAIAARITQLAAGRKAEPATCPSCGADLVPGKQFCAGCGRRL